MRVPNLHITFKVTGHVCLPSSENRHCALDISPIVIKFSPKISFIKLIKNYKIYEIFQNWSRTFKLFSGQFSIFVEIEFLHT